MLLRTLSKRLASTIATSLLLGAAFASHAEAADSPSYRRAPAKTPSAASCESARLSAWFERERQVTDGGGLVPVEIPQCDDSKRAQTARDQSRPTTEPRETARS